MRPTSGDEQAAAPYKPLTARHTQAMAEVVITTSAGNLKEKLYAR